MASAEQDYCLSVTSPFHKDFVSAVQYAVTRFQTMNCPALSDSCRAQNIQCLVRDYAGGAINGINGSRVINQAGDVMILLGNEERRIAVSFKKYPLVNTLTGRQINRRAGTHYLPGLSPFPLIPLYVCYKLSETYTSVQNIYLLRTTSWWETPTRYADLYDSAALDEPSLIQPPAVSEVDFKFKLRLPEVASSDGENNMEIVADGDVASSE